MASSGELRRGSGELHRASSILQKPMLLGVVFLPPSPKRPCHRIMLSRAGLVRIMVRCRCRVKG
jgi:hypothetical protein